MKNNAITQRLKGLIQNLENHVGYSCSITPFKNREQGTLRYSLFIGQKEHFETFLDIDFKTEGDQVNVLLPLEEQTVSFSVETINTICKTKSKTVGTNAFDLEVAREFLRSINSELKNNPESNKIIVISTKIRESHNEKEIETGSLLFNEEITQEADKLELSKERYYKSVRELNSARIQAQKEYSESEELKKVKELKAQLQLAQSALMSKERDINEKYNLEELSNNYKTTKINWNEIREEFSNTLIKICRKFKLPLVTAKTYQSVKETDPKQIEVVGNRLTRFF